MKAVSKLVLLVSAGILGSTAAWATPVEQQYLDTCRKDPGVPVPIAVVTPAVSADYAGTKVEVQFTVDATGTPRDLAVMSPADDTVGAVIVDAVKQWKFKPAERNGVPVPTKVALPVKIVDPSLPGESYAAN